MSIGMTADQFWKQDTWLKASYREKAELEKQRKSEEMWLQGLYFYNAIQTAVGNIFSKKGSARLKYIDEPLRITPLSEEEKAIKAEQEREKLVKYLNEWAKKFKE